MGRRVMRALLAVPDLEIVMLPGDAELAGNRSASSVAGSSVLAVDTISNDSRSAVDQAMSLGIPVVIGDVPSNRSPIGEGTFIAGALTEAELAGALASSMVDSGARPTAAQLAWTVPGRLLAAGTAVDFPRPVGPLWAGRAESPLSWPSATCLAAPNDTQWMAVAVRLETSDDEETGGLIRAVSDDAEFVKGVCMAAAVVAASRGAYPQGMNSPGDPDGVFMRLARAGGLEVAAFVPD